MTPFTIPPEYLDVVAVMAATAASVGLPARGAVRRGLSATLLIAFAAASLRITGGAEAVGSGLSATAFAITCGVALLGVVLLLSQVVSAFRVKSWDWWQRALVVPATVVALGFGAGPLISTVRTGGSLVAIVTAGSLLFLGALILLAESGIPLSRAIGRLDRALFARATPVSGPIGWTRAAALAWVHVACVVGLVLTAQLNLFMAIVIVALASGVLVERRLGRLRSIPLTTYIALLALGVAWYLLVHVAGELPVPLVALPDAPYSAAFQLAAALILGLVAWSLLRLWPFHGPPRGPLAPLLGGVLLARLIAPALPDGLAHWQPLWYLLAAIAAGHAMLARRDEEALGALAALGLASGMPGAATAGLGLAGAEALARMVRLLRAGGRVLNRRGRAMLALLLVAASPLLLWVLEGGLTAQVFYTVLTVALLAMLPWTSDGAAAGSA